MRSEVRMLRSSSTSAIVLFSFIMSRPGGRAAPCRALWLQRVSIVAEPISCFLSERYLNRLGAGSGQAGMSVDETAKQPIFSHVKETATAAREMVRAALKGSLASVLKPTGHPYASLLLTATEPDGTPLFLISKLALHTKNLSV